VLKLGEDACVITKQIFIVMFLTTALIVGCTYKSEDADSDKKPGKTALKRHEKAAFRHGGSKHVVLNKQNNFTDVLEQGCFTRIATSGPGTGEIIGKGFEFAKGDCINLEKKWLKTHDWQPDILGCSLRLLRSDWCARLKTDHSVKYTLHFLSWTIGPEGPEQRCMGDCAGNNNQTAYMRRRVSVQ